MYLEQAQPAVSASGSRESTSSRESTCQSASRWYAVQTRSRHEKAVSNRLSRSLDRCYLPLVDEVHFWSDRRKVVQVPLFPCYVFVRMEYSPRSHVAVQQTPNVVRLLGARTNELTIAESEIQNIQTVLAERIALAPYPFVKVGQKVRIRGGCLNGVIGILVAKERERNLVISVELIQRSMAIQVEGFDIEPVQAN